MDKLAIQITVALLLIYQARKSGWPWWGVLAGLIVGAIVVHLVYDFVQARISGSMGAAQISNDDPLMVAAIAEAKRTWPQFLDLFAEHPKDSLVKFRGTRHEGPF